MRGTLQAVWLLPLALSSALPARDERYFEKRSFNLADNTLAGLGSIKQDLMAGGAAINQQLYQAIEQPAQYKTCNPSNVQVRQEWSTFSKTEKKAYISAVQCLASLPSKTSPDVCPGCRNRYDDFVATHIQQSFGIHVTGNFLTWHRYFTWAYEQTLRGECGYKGNQPYYSYSRWYKDPTKSPLLDGSDTSISGQGTPGCKNQTFTGIPLNTNALIRIPHGAGGGCVSSGPFKDWQVNVGPMFPGSDCVQLNPNQNFTEPGYGLGYNPRCLTRDINSFTGEGWLKDDDIVSLLRSVNYQDFWENLQGGPPPNSFMNNFMGVHTAGHFIIGGDPGGDFMASPGDPFFFFHHASIDRLYWTWQNLKPAERTKALYGPTIMSDLGSAPATLQDRLTLGAAFFGNITIEEASSTMAGPFCYTYI
ncbi:FAD binding domain-containing protein [Stagonosporopsis vannaccii]|nr:FAD binding domain-containing protein [Stagonosporopsis vannaccii]